LETLAKKLEGLFAPILADGEFELVEIQVKGTKGSQSVKVFVDREGGIALDQCARISREFSDILDIADLIPGKYRLEVSSPGLTRPLKTERDFDRNINKRVSLIFQEGRQNRSIEGEIVAVMGGFIKIKTRKEELDISIDRVKQGNVILPW